MDLPETLTVLDLEDLMIALGRPTDRTNAARALQQHPIEGVTAPARRGQPWRIPRAAALEAVAACLRRREARTAAAARWGLPPLSTYHLAAARLMMEAGLSSAVTDRLRRAVRKEWREAEARALERVRLREAENERARRREERMRQREERRYHDAALLQCYCECRMAASAAWFKDVKGSYHDKPLFQEFLAAWPYPTFIKGAPDWWCAPPGMIEAMRERTDPWIRSQTGDIPNGRDLLPTDVDWRAPWPWRRETADG